MLKGTVYLFYAIVLIAIMLPQSLMATNGMNMIGYGAISSGMGGADLALVDNVTAMNINPAGLASCCGPQISIGDTIMQSRNHHQDHHGNDTQAEKKIFHLPLLAWAQPLDSSQFILGLGFFGQGGMGVHYGNVRTPFADMVAMDQERDELSSCISYAKITPTLAWHSQDQRLKLGASLNLGYVNAEMSLFPHTSLFVDNNHDGKISETGEVAFFGMEMTDSRAFASALRLGFQYQIGELTIGGAYLSRTKLKFDHGKTQINYSSIGLDTVQYNTKLDGLDWPQQAGLGFSYQINQKFKIVLDVDWINWSKSMKNIKFTLNKPNNSEAIPRIVVNYPMNWEDQWVVAIGAEYTITDYCQIRLGYNHGNNPIPDDNLLPYFPAIVKDHITFGTGLSWHQWQLDIALEWALKNSTESSNSPYSEYGFKDEISQFTTHIMISYFL
ncbi:MAG: hypothetical protein BA874_10785 [Desulfuromonadales bacterium C00003068]|jgi:long-chain fatty acid transport protein|nr:MAG: hypothetical protein BA874_10785 [Desulfuromonadales bacterium C00003068]